MNHYELAAQIASLLNRFNHLGSRYDASRILGLPKIQYAYRLNAEGTEMVGCAGLQKQSYVFSEIKHVSVDPKCRGKGVAGDLVSGLLKQNQTPFFYCTVRVGNEPSLKLFKRLGFSPISKYQGLSDKVVVLFKENPNHEILKSPDFVEFTT